MRSHSQPTKRDRDVRGRAAGSGNKVDASSKVGEPSDTMMSISTSPRQSTDPDGVHQLSRRRAGSPLRRWWCRGGPRPQPGTLSILWRTRLNWLDVLDFDRDSEADGAVVVGHRLHIDDVDLLVGQQRADVLEQADPVPGAHMDR